MEAMKKLLRANIDSAKGSSVVGYSFDDEISTGSFCSPIETDGSPASAASTGLNPSSAEPSRSCVKPSRRARSRSAGSRRPPNSPSSSA